MKTKIHYNCKIDTFRWVIRRDEEVVCLVFEDIEKKKSHAYPLSSEVAKNLGQRLINLSLESMESS